LQPQPFPHLNATVATDAHCDGAEEIACRDALRIATSFAKVINADRKMFGNTLCEGARIESDGESILQRLKLTE